MITETTTSSRQKQARQPLTLVPIATAVVVAEASSSASTTLEPFSVAVSLGIATMASVYLNSPKTSDGVRDYWDKNVMQGANKATIAAEDVAAKKSLSLPALNKDNVSSPEQLTLMMQDVANTVEQQNKEYVEEKTSLVERILPKKVSRVFINRNMDPVKPFTPKPMPTKNRFVVKLLKKIVMPWKKWRNL
jgi:hypothetical protein